MAGAGAAMVKACTVTGTVDGAVPDTHAANTNAMNAIGKRVIRPALLRRTYRTTLAFSQRCQSNRYENRSRVSRGIVALRRISREALAMMEEAIQKMRRRGLMAFWAGAVVAAIVIAAWYLFTA
jgi:hypothetical protein